ALGFPPYPGPQHFTQLQRPPSRLPHRLNHPGLSRHPRDEPDERLSPGGGIVPKLFVAFAEKPPILQRGFRFAAPPGLGNSGGVLLSLRMLMRTRLPAPPGSSRGNTSSA